MATDLALVAALENLGAGLQGIDLRFDLTNAPAARRELDELSNQIVDYLVPRLRRLDAPLLAVLGGSTGSGKSTITNSLADAEVSPAGVLRPTTRAPVLICHPDDVEWFSANDDLPGILPGLPRVTGEGFATGSTLKVRPVATLIPGLALIDAPDIDSVEEANRELATQLLAAADLWLFVTTAVRYADAVPWEFLGRAQDRGTSLAVVINRMPPGAAAEIVPHLQQMLTAGGLENVTIFPIEQSDLIHDRLPGPAVADIRTMLTRLATDAEERARVVRTTIDGAVSSIPGRARRVLAASAAQDQAVEALRTALESSYADTRAQIARDLAGGALLRGEVLDRWQELIGTNEMMRAIQSRITSLRDRITGFVRGRDTATTEVRGEITSALEQLLIDHADAAALGVVTTWRQLPGGPSAMNADRSLSRSSDALKQRAAGEIRAWQDDVLDLVRQRGSGKRTMARAMAFGVNGVGVALMIVLFAQTGGITGGEVAVASGTATISQALLNAVFGEQAVRELAEDARRKLLARVESLLDEDADRFREALTAAAPPPGVTEQLRRSLNAFESLG